MSKCAHLEWVTNSRRKAAAVHAPADLKRKVKQGGFTSCQGALNISLSHVQSQRDAGIECVMYKLHSLSSTSGTDTHVDGENLVHKAAL